MAQNIALRYERFVSGYSNFFNHETDIDLTARTVGLNFKDVPDSMLVFALISFCETVRNIMYSNFDQGRRDMAVYRGDGVAVQVPLGTQLFPPIRQRVP